MYPQRELKDLARLRSTRLRSIERHRQANCDSLRQVASPLLGFDWILSTWRATQLPASLAMMPVEHLLHRLDPSQLESAQRLLRGALLTLAAARKLDQIVDDRPIEAPPP